MRNDERGGGDPSMGTWKEAAKELRGERAECVNQYLVLCM